jgi:DNA primase
VAAASQRVGDFYSEVVLPALSTRLDAAFPEFGWKQDPRGWVATNQEMTHRVLGVRADRVVAHGAAPPGFLVHGGEPMPWTAYLNGGEVPRGESFRSVVRELADRAGVDSSPIERAQPRDRRQELLHDFFRLSRAELQSERGGAARSYLVRRGLPADEIDQVDLGVVPSELLAKNALQAAGYTELEIAESGVLADGRWPGRLCGAWRNEQARIGTLWARAIQETDTSSRYLYLRGASRSGLPPYGLSDVLRLPADARCEITLVEGLIDVHHLRSKGFASVAAIGGARVQPDALRRFERLGIDSVVLALDNDASGRDGTARAVERITSLTDAPTLRVLDPEQLGDSKDPDAFVREHGVTSFGALVADADCAVSWRAREFVRGITPDSEARRRRAALACAGSWLGTLRPRYALEQEDAVRQVSERCGYSREAVQRAFRARFWDRLEGRGRAGLVIER